MDAAFAQEHVNVFAVGHRRVAGVTVFGDVALITVFAIVDREIQRPLLLAGLFIEADDLSFGGSIAADVADHDGTVADDHGTG